MTGAAEVLGAATKSSSSPVFLIVLVGIVGAVYFLFLRPQQQKQKQHRAQQSQAEVGDEVLTVGGIVGRVVDVAGDRVTIVSGEESEGTAAAGSVPTRLVLVRQGIARKIEPVVVDDELDDDHDDDDDDDRAREDHDQDHDAGDDGPPKGSRER